MPRCKGCGSLLPSGAKSCPSCGLEVPSPQMFSIGEIFDEKYEILSFLGAGGMGEIYKVKHIHLEDVRVIKIMRHSFVQEEQDLKRFLLEAKIATKLHHQNVAILYDFSQYKTGLFYMVWEYIPGFDISVVLKKCGKMAPSIAIYFITQALDGLGFIHKNGIVHRDISPENLMIYKDQFGDYKLKIIDLGIAKTTAMAGEHLTQTGMFLGKLKYCSPEQVGALEEGEKIDGRTDIYSIGLVLYEMLSGKSAIYSTTPYGYIHKHITQTPDPLQLMELTEENNKKLNEVIFKALEKNRKFRFQTSENFKEELLFLPINEPEQEELEKYLMPLFLLEEKKVEIKKDEESPTILTPSKPSPEVVFKKEMEEKETIRTTELEKKETVYVTPKPQTPIKETKIVAEKPTTPSIKKKKNFNIFMISGIAILILAVFSFGIFKIKNLKKKETPEVLFQEKQEKQIQENTVPKTIVETPGILKIHILPYAKIKKLSKENGENFNLEDRITPLCTSLSSGEYLATLEVEPTKEIVKINFKIKPGQITEIIKTGNPKNYKNVLENLF